MQQIRTLILILLLVCTWMGAADGGAGYAITIDPVTQQAYLKASNTGQPDFFGRSVAISGDTVVVGANEESSSATGVNGNQSDDSAEGAGAVYVFVRVGGTWTQQAYLKASNTGEEDSFGVSVAISGDTIVAGSPFEDSGASGINGNQSDNSKGNAGAVYVFVRSGGVWSQQAYLKASNPGAGDRFGGSVAISGDTVVVGAPSGDSNGSAADSGAAYVFVRSGGVWSQQAYLKASNTGPGQFFGGSVAISDDTVVVGAPYEDSNGSAVLSGAVYVFVRTGGVWSQQAYLKASNSDAGDFFGEHVTIAGDTLVVGARGEDSNATGINGNQGDNSALDSGAAYVFARSGGVWNQQAYLKASNSAAGDLFGGGLAIAGSTVAVGAIGEASNATGIDGDQSNNSSASSGATYLFVRSGGTWTQSAYVKASNTGAGDQFGVAMALSDDTLVVGAFWEDSGATGVNGDGSNNTKFDSGAAYVFTVPSQLTYQFEGFFAPVQGGGVLNNVKAGRAVPLKWRVLDGQGQAVTTLTNVSIKVEPVSCSQGTVIGPEIEADAAGASGLQNLGNGYYQFNWKTSTSLTNSCATLHLDLGDGLNHTALFLLR